MTVNAGDLAPDFSMPGDTGPVSMADLTGKAVVLYFYPKDDTSGCTNEAKGFTEAAAEFDAIGAVVIGASKDTVASHAKFRAKYGLTPLLGSDADSDVIERYGVWVEKNMYGRKYMGIERSTFLIDREGLVRRVWRKVKVPGHVAEVLAAATALG